MAKLEYRENRSSTQLKRCLLPVLLSLLAACGGGSGGGSAATQTPAPTPNPVDYQYQQPEQRSDGWQTLSAYDAGIDVERLEDLMNSIGNNELGFRFMDGITIVKDNMLVFDELIRTQTDFADDWAANQDVELHVLNSVTKSITSAVVGIAIDQGHINGVDVLVHDYFPDKLPALNWNNDKANITLKNWLTMRHGYEWDEWNVNYLEPSNLNTRMNNAVDPLQFLIDRPMLTQPGSTFAYSTGVSYGIGAIVSRATGESFSSYMNTHLLMPLGIEKFDYWSLQGQLHTGSALYLTPRDMAKFGQLFLDDGVWMGQRIVSAQWVEESTQAHVIEDGFDYGYQWWRTTFAVNGENISSYYADGFGGQHIFIFDDINAVVILTGRRYEDSQARQASVRDMLQSYILPALTTQNQ